jgi:hypothetical protein
MIVPDPLVVADRWGEFWALLMIVLVVLAGIIWRRINRLLREHEEATKNINVSVEHIKHPDDPEGKKLISRGDLYKEFRKGRDELHEINETIQSKCCVETCPAISIIDKNLKAMDKRIEDFCTRAEVSRKDTQHLIEQIFDRINNFINELGSKMIIALQTLAGLKNKSNKED